MSAHPNQELASMNKLLAAIPLALSLIVLLSACSTTKDIEVSAAADPKVKLSTYKTYSWLAAGAMLLDPSAKWQPPGFAAGDTVKELIDQELKKRSMVITDKNPDLSVVFAVGINMEATKLKTDPGATTSILKNVPQGSLGIVLIDNKSGFVVWMATATAEIQKNASDQVVRQRLEYAVTKMFEQMPAN